VSVVVSAVAPGFNAETYEAVTGRAMPGDQLPDGCKLHIAGPVEQGWRVITVWESREAFDRFREEKLIPAIREITGEQAPPAVEPEVNPVHKLITS
jgi:heme-degrading monooxygenase HmoA